MTKTPWIVLLAFLPMTLFADDRVPPTGDVLAYLKSQGNQIFISRTQQSAIWMVNKQMVHQAFQSVLME